MGKWGRSMRRSMGLSAPKQHNSILLIENFNMNNTEDIKNITVDSIKCKDIIPYIDRIKDRRFREKIRKLCKFKENYPNRRSVSVMHITNMDNKLRDQETAEELIAEICYKIVMDYNRKHKIKLAESEFNRRLKAIIGEPFKSLNELIFRYNDLIGPDELPIPPANVVRRGGKTMKKRSRR
jgi:hypothetical protein